MRTSLLRVTGGFAGVASSLVLFGGVAAAQTTVNLSDTGRDSRNIVKFTDGCSLEVRNKTDVNIHNNNSQNAESGDVKVKDNDDVGTVGSGNASNTSTARFNVSVTNSTPNGCGTTTQAPAPTTGGGGGGGGGVVGGGGGGGTTTTPVTMPAATTPSGGGGSGGGDVLGAATVQQVAAVPVGGVGAGGGGVGYIGGLIAVTLASGALATRRLYRIRTLGV